MQVFTSLPKNCPQWDRWVQLCRCSASYQEPVLGGTGGFSYAGVAASYPETAFSQTDWSYYPYVKLHPEAVLGETGEPDSSYVGFPDSYPEAALDGTGP